MSNVPTPSWDEMEHRLGLTSSRMGRTHRCRSLHFGITTMASTPDCTNSREQESSRKTTSRNQKGATTATTSRTRSLRHGVTFRLTSYYFTFLHRYNNRIFEQGGCWAHALMTPAGPPKVAPVGRRLQISLKQAGPAQLCQAP